MSNGNGIIESKAAQARLIKEDHAKGERIKLLIKQNDDVHLELYQSEQAGFNKDSRIRRLKDLNNLLCVALLAAIVLIITKWS